MKNTNDTPDDLDPASEAEEKYKDPNEPIVGSPGLHDLSNRIKNVRDESS